MALESNIAFEENRTKEAWELLSGASVYYSTMYTYLTAEDLPYVYAKAGSRRLAPFVSQVINEARNRLSPILNPSDDSVSPVLYAKIGGTERVADQNTAKMYDGDEQTYVSWQVVQKAGDYYGLDLGRVISVKDVSILQGKNDTDHDIFHDAVLQYSEDKKTWTDVECVVDGQSVTTDGLNVKARYVRYYLNSEGYNGKPDYWTFVREFTVNKKEESHDRVYTNVESVLYSKLFV